MTCYCHPNTLQKRAVCFFGIDPKFNLTQQHLDIPGINPLGMLNKTGIKKWDCSYATTPGIKKQTKNTKPTNNNNQRPIRNNTWTFHCHSIDIPLIHGIKNQKHHRAFVRSLIPSFNVSFQAKLLNSSSAHSRSRRAVRGLAGANGGGSPSGSCGAKKFGLGGATRSYLITKGITTGARSYYQMRRPCVICLVLFFNGHVGFARFRLQPFE